MTTSDKYFYGNLLKQLLYSSGSLASPMRPAAPISDFLSHGVSIFIIDPKPTEKPSKKIVKIFTGCADKYKCTVFAAKKSSIRQIHS